MQTAVETPSYLADAERLFCRRSYMWRGYSRQRRHS